jgi:hypothetical protein
MGHRRLSWPSLLVTLFLFFTTSIVCAASPGNCSLATLKGTYGGVEQGTILLDLGFGIPVPFQAVVAGAATYDGAGSFTVTYTASFGGISFPGTAAGTYAVNPDCTYSDVVPATDAHRQGTITGEGMLQEIHTVFTDAWVVGSGTRKKTPPGNCSASTLKGTYALFGQGTIATPATVPVVHAGIITFDGRGNFSGHDTGNVGGATLPDTFTGTYTVSGDCTLSAVIFTTLFPPLHEAGVITGVGINQEVHNIMTEAGWVFVDTAKQQ